MAYKGYEGLLGEWGEAIPYSTFESEAGMRKSSQKLAAKAELTKQLREAEPEGATSAYFTGGQRGNALAHYGAQAKRFGERRARVIGAEGRVAGGVESEEQINKLQYIGQNLEDMIDAEKETVKAKGEFDRATGKAVAQYASMGVGMGLAASVALYNKHDAMKKSLTPEEQAELDAQREAEIEERKKLALEGLGRAGDLPGIEEAERAKLLQEQERSKIMGKSESALTEAGALGHDERVFHKAAPARYGVDPITGKSVRGSLDGEGARSPTELLSAARSPDPFTSKLAIHELKRRALAGTLPPALLRLPQFRDLDDSAKITVGRYGGGSGYSAALGDAGASLALDPVYGNPLGSYTVSGDGDI